MKRRRPGALWKQRMTVSMGDLMSDDVDPSEELHMSLHSTNEERKPDHYFMLVSNRRAPISNTIIRESEEECLLVDSRHKKNRRRTYYPRYGRDVVMDREDLEKKLEAFRKRIALVDFNERELRTFE